jgi:hypothetical protein
MTAALTNLIHKIFPGLPVGATGAGGKPTHHPVRRTPSPAPPTPRKTNPQEDHRHTQAVHYNIHIHGDPTPHQMSKAELALFNARNKYRH